jgi:hypothetical protein
MSDAWRLLVVGYLLWLMAFAVVEGLGREACRMPTRTWIAAGADVRDRTIRATFRDRASLCLDETAWYAYGMRVLVPVALLLPIAGLWLVRRRREPVRSLTFVTGLTLTLGSIAGVRWMYDWLA